MQQLGGLAPDPEYLTNFRTGIENDRLRTCKQLSNESQGIRLLPVNPESFTCIFFSRSGGR